MCSLCSPQLVQDRTWTSVTWQCFEGARNLQKTEKPLDTFAKMSVLSYCPNHHHHHQPSDTGMVPLRQFYCKI